MLYGAPVTVQAFAATYDRVAARTLEPRWFTRVGARVRSHALDRALIAGADPSESPLLAARARALTSRATRVLMARGIERLLERAQEPPRLTRVSPHRVSVAMHAEQLRAVAALLRERSPVYARGMAIVGDLLSDGAGPAYSGEPEALGERLREAHAALGG
jgi:hypothetical protein